MERQRQGESSSYSNRKKLAKREQQLDPMERHRESEILFSLVCFLPLLDAMVRNRQEKSSS